MSHHVLELSRFAYKSALSSSRAPPPTDNFPSRPTVVIKKDSPDHLPDSQLTRLSKCIGCGLQWTSRKSAKQKRTHIEQCAKKNALTKDTIRILIEKEIAILSPTQNTASSRLPANDLNENATLMDSVIPPGPLKKIKRQQVVPTIRSLPETRESILDRARDILGPMEGQVDPQPTQQFGRSALARRQTQQPKHPASLDVNGLEEPPPTQPFGASSLRGGITTSEQSIDDCEEPSFPLTQQFGASMFAQDSVSSSDRVSAFACFYLILS
ncbi:hypothetical protein J3R83DRAFT_867 [Lanmaoa asiatica]|nr:hypothetical protein J3R83DRAFT_867 [Lanmaoa asiatica]